MPDKITRVVLEVFAAAGGWTFAPSTPDGYGYSWFDAKNVNRGHELPDFLHDLQACVDVLERVFADYDLRRRNGVAFICEIYRPSQQWDAVAATKEEAIILAVYRSLTKGGET